MLDIPILSIKQPWAWVILTLGKDIENRTWNTKFRGKFYIHAGKKPDPYGLQYIRNLAGNDFVKNLQYGGIVGVANLVDCVLKSDSVWHEKVCYGFVLKDIELVPFYPLKGQLGFFRIKETK